VDVLDTDGRVYVRGIPHSHEAVLPIGEFTWGKIIGRTDYDLIAEPTRFS
jgi:hypothetical protein